MTILGSRLCQDKNKTKNRREKKSEKKREKKKEKTTTNTNKNEKTTISNAYSEIQYIQKVQLHAPHPHPPISANSEMFLECDS